MKILLLGEYSNVHWTLAEGLRERGHKVVVASNGDFWKDYPRDIDLKRSYSKLGGIALMAKIALNFPKLRGFDVVQVINPMFMELKAERLLPIYKYLRRNNKRVVMGAFGMDYYWIEYCRNPQNFRYSDFNIGDKLRDTPDTRKEIADWIGTPKETLNKYIARDCDAIVGGLYELWACYQPDFKEKTTFIPYPIRISEKPLPQERFSVHTPLRLFIGIQRSRSAYKGTDIMLKAARKLQGLYPEKVELRVAENVPFDEYTKLMEHSDVLLDQLYSYTPSMNPLGAMAKGIVCVGGGEPENYEILNETELRPIVNVEPNFEDVYKKLEELVLNPSNIPMLKQQSVEYIKRHHDYKKIAERYETLYKKLI